MLHLIFYDTETTGTQVDKDRVVEIAAYNPQTKANFVAYINPQIPIPEEAAKIHGITDDLVAEADIFPKVYQQFVDFCGSDSVLVAHNNDAFDYPLLNKECVRHSITPTTFPSIDSLKWAKKYRPDLPKHNLQYLRQVYGFSENRAHRALDDVIILEQVFSSMTDDLSVSQILELLSETINPKTFRMPFGKHKGKLLSDVPSSYLTWLEEQGALDKPENNSLKEVIEFFKQAI